MSEHYDLLVIGGGPSGSTAALVAARRDLSVALVEKDPHPRFHIGESFLPRNLTLLRELGLEADLKRIPHVRKLGASFALGHEETLKDYHFRNRLGDEEFAAFNIERAPFDAMLYRNAVAAGARAFEGHTVTRVLRLVDGAVEVEACDADGRQQRITARCLVDASGQSTVVARHLGRRRTLSGLKKVAYFGHFTGIERRPGYLGGYPLAVMCREGWFWLIPIDSERTSIGLVVDRDVCKRASVSPSRMLAWGIERTPMMRRLTQGADLPPTNRVTADFSYTCRPYSGPGFFLVGDAATFVDPIFSTGVLLGMMSAVEAVDRIEAMFSGSTSAGAARRRYDDFVQGSSTPFFRLVRRYYQPPFRDLLLEGEGPLEVHRAVISVLSGHVFPRPRAGLRVRLLLMDLLTSIQRLIPMGPRRAEFSLLQGMPVARRRFFPAG